MKTASGFILDVDKNRLENAPGFDKSNWPNMAETSWDHGVRKYWSASGDYGIEAGRRYDSVAPATPKQEIEHMARDAREAIDGPEGNSLRRAEEIGKERSRGDNL
jgi:hypothetical protein